MNLDDIRSAVETLEGRTVNRHARRAEASRKRHAEAMRAKYAREREARLWARDVLHGIDEVYLNGRRVYGASISMKKSAVEAALTETFGATRRQPAERCGTGGDFSIDCHPTIDVT